MEAVYSLLPPWLAMSPLLWNLQAQANTFLQFIAICSVPTPVISILSANLLRRLSPPKDVTPSQSTSRKNSHKAFGFPSIFSWDMHEWTSTSSLSLYSAFVCFESLLHKQYLQLWLTSTPTDSAALATTESQGLLNIDIWIRKVWILNFSFLSFRYLSWTLNPF